MKTEQVSLVVALPRCRHQQALCDWSGESLVPPCGCTLRTADEALKKMAAMIKLGLHVVDMPVLTRDKLATLADVQNFPAGYGWKPATMQRLAALALVENHAFMGIPRYYLTELGEKLLRARGLLKKSRFS